MNFFIKTSGLLGNAKRKVTCFIKILMCRKGEIMDWLKIISQILAIVKLVLYLIN